MNGLVSQRLKCVLLVFLLLFVSLPIRAEGDESIDSDALLVDLGIQGAIDQIDRVITHTVANVNHRTYPLLNPDQLQQLRQQLKSSSGSAFVGAEMRRYFSEHLPADIQPSIDKLNDELVLRVRNFDVSLEVKGAIDKYTAFEQALIIDEVAPQRLALLRRLDDALKVSSMAGLLQAELTHTAVLAVQVLGKSASSEKLSVLLSNKESERLLTSSHMADVLIRIHLFTYRFMPDQELQRYVETLEDPGIQPLLNIGQQGLLLALKRGRERVLSQLTVGTIADQ